MPDISSLLSHRGNEVFDREGRKVGRLEEIYVDDDTEEPKWALVHTGAFSSRKVFVPLAGAKPAGSGLRLAFSKAQVVDAPRVDGEAHLSLQAERALHRYYGVAEGRPAEPSRSEAPTGEMTTDRTAAAGAAGAGAGATDGAMTRSEEELHVEKAQRATGRARLRKHVVTEHVTITVPVQREEVRLEHEPMDAADAGADVDAADQPAAAGGGLGRSVAEAGDSEGQAELVLHEEEIVIDKRVVPKERVRLVKDVVTEDEQVDDVVRKEQIEMERDKR